MIYTIFKSAWIRVPIGLLCLLVGLASFFTPLFYSNGVAFWSPKLSILLVFGGIFILILPITFLWPGKGFDEDRLDRIARMAEEKRRAKAPND